MATGYYLRQYAIDYLANAGGVNSTTGTITLQDGSKITNPSKPGVGILSYTTPLVESDIEWFTFTSYNTTTKTFVGVSRAAEGSTGKSHANGVKVAFPVSRSHINPIVDAVSIAGSATNIATKTVALTSSIADSETELITASYMGNQTSTTSSATPTPTGDRKRNELYVTALAEAAELQAPSGTPANGNKLIVRIKDNGTARALTYNAIYRGVIDTLPATTAISKTLYMGFAYNSADSKWDLLAVAEES